MKISDTVIGGSYWFVGPLGPYRERRHALSSARLAHLKDFESYLRLGVRVAPKDLRPGFTIRYGSGECFQVTETYPLDQFGRVEVTHAA